MQCKNCELDQRRFSCERCLCTRVRKHRTTLGHVAGERDEYVSKAERELKVIQPARQRRATVATLLSRIESFKNQLRIINQRNAEAQERLASLRSSLSSRREALSIACTLLKPDQEHLTVTQTHPSNAQQSVATPASVIPRIREAHLILQDSIARARSGLVQELVEVFGIFEVGGRPPLGGKAGTKGEWTIGGLVLPVPGDIRRYPPSQINAVLTHTIHFVSLLTFYLGVKLPFEIVWSGGKLGVGQPAIYAGKGGEFGGWARWSSKNPLHLPPSSVPLAPSISAPVSSDSASPALKTRTKTLSTPASTSTPTSQSSHFSQEQQDHMSQSFTELPVSAQPPASFTTALAMLLYNVAYLAFTQSVDVPLSQTGEILRNLWAICCSPDLGRRSHETHPLLVPPTPPQFPLDFAQLLQATTANPASRTRARSSSRSSSGAGRTSNGRSKSKKQEIIIEEDEWDLVEDAAKD